MITLIRIGSFQLRERGVALVMALVFLLLLTILGLTAMSTTSLQEKMAGNAKDRDQAFQAAETALVFAENWLNNQVAKPVFPNTAQGLYQPDLTLSQGIWETLNWTGSSGLVTYPGTPGQAVSSGGLSTSIVYSQPKYIIEDLGELPESGGSLVMAQDYKGKGNTVLRVTARGTGGTDAAQAMVQSVFSHAY